MAEGILGQIEGALSGVETAIFGAQETAVTAQSTFIQFAGQSVWDLILYVIGISLYAIFVWHFYKYVARRDVFKWNVSKYHAGGRAASGFFYFLKYLFVYPILVFLWFSVFATLIFILGSLEDFNALLVSFAMVGAIRLTAYYNEDISNDLGKMLPLAMLGVFILQPNFLQIEGVMDRFFNLGLFSFDILKFVAVAVVSEWVLRVVWSIKRRISSREESTGMRYKKDIEDE